MYKNHPVQNKLLQPSTYSHVKSFEQELETFVAYLKSYPCHKQKAGIQHALSHFQTHSTFSNLTPHLIAEFKKQQHQPHSYKKGFTRSMIDCQNRMQTFHTFYRAAVSSVLKSGARIISTMSDKRMQYQQFEELKQKWKRLQQVHRMQGLKRPVSVVDYWAEKYYKEIMDLSEIDHIAYFAEADMIEAKKEGLIQKFEENYKQMKLRMPMQDAFLLRKSSKNLKRGREMEGGDIKKRFSRLDEMCERQVGISALRIRKQNVKVIKNMHKQYLKDIKEQYKERAAATNQEEDIESRS